MSSAVQIFPQEDSVLAELKKLCLAFNLPGDNCWMELSSIFTSITFEDTKESGFLWISLGAVEYRMSIKIPGVCTGCSPDMDFEALAEIASVEEVLTIHWKNEKNWLETEAGITNLPIIVGIPFPQNEVESAHLAACAPVPFLLPQAEQKQLFKVEENQITSIQDSHNNRSICEAALIKSSIDDDYLLEVFCPPSGCLRQEDTLLAVSQEGIYFEQATRKLYIAAKAREDIDEYEILPSLNPSDLIYIKEAEILQQPEEACQITAKANTITLSSLNQPAIRLFVEQTKEFTLITNPLIVSLCVTTLKDIQEPMDITGYFYAETNQFLVSLETAPATYTFLFRNLAGTST